MTIPSNAAHPQAAAKVVDVRVRRQGHTTVQQSRVTGVNPAIASGLSNVPASIQSLVKAWPGQ